jgi:hypothetical protein
VTCCHLGRRRRWGVVQLVGHLTVKKENPFPSLIFQHITLGLVRQNEPLLGAVGEKYGEKLQYARAQIFGNGDEVFRYYES